MHGRIPGDIRFPLTIAEFLDKVKFKDISYDSDGKHSDVFLSVYTKSLSCVKELPSVRNLCIVHLRRNRDCLSHKCKETEGHENEKESRK